MAATVAMDDYELSNIPAPSGAASRRALLALFGAGALVTMARAQSEKTESLSPAQLRNRFLRRTSYGPLEREVTKATQMGYDAYLEYQLDYEAIDDSQSEHEIEWYSTVFWSVRDLFKAREDVVAHELAAATILRAVWSKRQLYQRMVEFWTDHFNIHQDKVGVLKTVHDRDVIRRHALGNFRDLLMANAKSPAMLLYLDNTSSSRESPNQNLAREIMELHSLGTNGGFTQDDVIAMSKCLTGWTTVLWPYDAENVGQFYYDRTMHHNGPKTFLGKEFPSGQGIKDGEQAVNMLSIRRACGKLLGRKLCLYFLGHLPSEELENEIADVFGSTKGDIKSMLRVVLRQDNLAASPLTLKRPFHYAMGLIRHSAATISGVWSVQEMLNQLGQHPFAWAPPNGYPMEASRWRTGMLARWNAAYEVFADQEVDDLHVTRAALLKDANRLDSVLDRIDKVMLMNEMTTKNRDYIRNALGSNATAVGKSLNGFAIAATLPGYQKC
jgi:uncharacterized protein (DUF1800 family)